MGTCNFHSMKNFDLWVKDNFYYKVCPECNFGGQDGDECEFCGTDLTDVQEEFDDIAEECFYEDVLQDLDEANKNLLFHEITIKPGYYVGLQLYVELNNAAYNAGFCEYSTEDVDNESTQYYFDMCRSATIRKYKAEQRRINKILAQIGRDYGMDKLGVLGVFSNGEAVYVKEATA